MQQIPQIQSDDRVQNQLQSNLLNVLNPMFKNNPILFGNTLKSVQLAIGDNTISTGLTESLQGWIVIRKRGLANIYDKQDTNNVPKTLILNSDSIVNIDLIVF